MGELNKARLTELRNRLIASQSTAPSRRTYSYELVELLEILLEDPSNFSEATHTKLPQSGSKGDKV